jgi:hypothetical protein
VVERAPRERQVLDRAARQDREHLLDLGPAEQPIDADLAADPRRAQARLGRRAHDLHVARRAELPDPARQHGQHLGRDADVLEPDVREAHGADVVEDVEAIGHRLVRARQHEDEVHGCTVSPSRDKIDGAPPR